MALIMKRTAFYLSDGTGITAETLGHSMLSQFGDIEFVQVTLPFVQSDQQTREAVERINKACQEDGVKPVVFSTLVNNEHREILHSCKGMVLDLFGAFLNPLEEELGVRSNHKINQSHAIRDADSYRIRINAVHFALDNDDGARTRHYDQADVILIGVSRSGKTPTSLYLALQFGLFTANYPLTEDDFDDLRLPTWLMVVVSDNFCSVLIAATTPTDTKHDRWHALRHAAYLPWHMTRPKGAFSSSLSAD